MRKKLGNLKIFENHRHFFSKIYLRYLRRHHLDVDDYREARLCLQFLRHKNELPTLKTWSIIKNMSGEFESFAANAKRARRGRPFIKVGCVLQELGALPIREDVYELDVEAKFTGLCQSLAVPLQSYVSHLRRTRRSEKTVYAVVSRVKHFHDWLADHYQLEPWSASEQVAHDYLASRQKGIMKERQPLNRFYWWAKTERYTLLNPFENIATSQPKSSLKVCSPEQIKKIEKFISSARSEPEAAMILSLIFYWGIKIKELSYATVEFETENMKIIFHRSELSFGNSRHRRAQILSLPQNPPWLMKLQKKFKIVWLDRFKNVRADIPRQPLVLHRRGQHNRPLNTLAVRRIYYKAIEKACGISIPPNVLRRAGADLYAKQNAAGVLQTMGWSKANAFKFTWLPRQYFHP